MNTCLFLWKSTTPCLLNGFTNCACLQLSGCKKCPQFKPLFTMNVKFSETVRGTGLLCISVAKSKKMKQLIMIWEFCDFWANIPATQTDSFFCKILTFGSILKQPSKFLSGFELKSFGPLKVLGVCFCRAALENVLRVHHALERATTTASGSCQRGASTKPGWGGLKPLLRRGSKREWGRGEGFIWTR